MKNHLIVKIVSVIILLIAVGYFVWSKSTSQPSGISCTMEAKLCPDGSYVGRTGSNCEFSVCSGYELGLGYKNTDYGFSVALPDTWREYTVSIDKWTGYAVNDQLGEVPYATGSVVSIHNPKWTKELMYQDIPVMVFTLGQWSDLQAEKFHIGAAPIGPSELDRNSEYVFALPARYNYAFALGFEEVEQIIQGKPLRAF